MLPFVNLYLMKTESVFLDFVEEAKSGFFEVSNVIMPEFFLGVGDV
jgi:hypothetical protein